MKAEEVECFGLPVGTMAEIELKAGNQHFNCIYFPDLPTGIDIHAVVTSPDSVKSDINLFDISSGGGELISSKSSNALGQNNLYINDYNTDLAIKIKPKDYTSRNKDLRLSMVIINGVAYLNIALFDTNNEYYHVPVGGGYCEDHICYEPKVVSPSPDDSSTAFYTNSSNVCTSAETPPGVPEDFDINRQLQNMENFANYLDSVMPPAQATSMKLAYVNTMFFPYSIYDFKYGGISPWSGTAEFGNWWFGASMSALGFDEQVTLYLASFAQSIQDIDDYTSFQQGADNIWDAMNGVNVDNPDDPPVIIGGRSYDSRVRSNDPNKDSNVNSCEPESSDEGGYPAGSSGAGAGGGWMPVGFSFDGGSFREMAFGPDTSCSACKWTMLDSSELTN